MKNLNTYKEYLNEGNFFKQKEKILNKENIEHILDVIKKNAEISQSFVPRLPDRNKILSYNLKNDKIIIKCSFKYYNNEVDYDYTIPVLDYYLKKLKKTLIKEFPLSEIEIHTKRDSIKSILKTNTIALINKSIISSNNYLYNIIIKNIDNAKIVLQRDFDLFED